MSSIFGWFLAMSIRWKLQFSFFMVTMITIVINRWVGYGELEAVIRIAREATSDAQTLARLDAHLDAYVTDSFWQSGLEFVVLFMVIGLLANLLVKPIRSLCKALESIEKGDLTKPVPNQSRDEIGILERSFNAMLTNLNFVIRSIDESGKQMASSAFQVATISHEIAEVSRNEHRRSQDVSSATERLQRVSESVMEVAEDATQRALRTERQAHDGMAIVQRNISGMDEAVAEVNTAAEQVSELNGAARKIYDIISTISTIAEQTNLLALNAAIEAARAGEQGRGFAVVADEVRSLAARTTVSTDEITDIINSLTRHVDQVSQTMQLVVDRVHASQESARATADVIESMAADVSQTASANRRISDVSSEQMGEFATLQAGLDRLFETFKESSTKVGTTATIGDDLYRITERNNALLSRFRFERVTAIEPSSHEKRAAPRLDSSLRVQISVGGRKLEGVTSDISMTGMKLRLNERLPQDNAPLVLSVYLPYADLKEYKLQSPVTLSGKVVWQREEGARIATGICFIGLTDRQRDDLNRCFRYFEKEPEFAH